MDLVPLKKHSLTSAQFEQLADVPPEEEWLANITNLKTRRAYKEDVREFIAFTGLQDYMRLRSVGRSHIISWRKDMERRGLAPATILRKLSALSSLSWPFASALVSEELAGAQAHPRERTDTATSTTSHAPGRSSFHLATSIDRARAAARKLGPSKTTFTFGRETPPRNPGRHRKCPR